jgi:hypothetical protein
MTFLDSSQLTMTFLDSSQLTMTFLDSSQLTMTFLDSSVKLQRQNIYKQTIRFHPKNTTYYH